MSWQVGLYATAVLIPLAAFAVEAIFIRQLKRLNAYIATGAIAFSCLLSLIGFLSYAWESSFFHHAAHGRRRATRIRCCGPRGWRTARPCGRRREPPQAGRLVGEFRLGRPGRACRRRRRPGAAAPDLVVPLGIAIDSLSVDHVRDGHVHRDPDPHLFDGLHA